MGECQGHILKEQAYAGTLLPPSHEHTVCHTSKSFYSRTGFHKQESLHKIQEVFELRENSAFSFPSLYALAFLVRFEYKHKLQYLERHL